MSGRRPWLWEALETAVTCQRVGSLPEAGGLDDQDEDMVEAMRIVEAERAKAPKQKRD